VTGRPGRRHRKLLDDLKERRGYPHLKEEALDRTMWRAGFGRGFEPVMRQIAKWSNKRNRSRASLHNLKSVQHTSDSRQYPNKHSQNTVLESVTKIKFSYLSQESLSHLTQLKFYDKYVFHDNVTGA
jgi:hypothetical protein